MLYTCTILSCMIPVHGAAAIYSKELKPYTIELQGFTTHGDTSELFFNISV